MKSFCYWVIGYQFLALIAECGLTQMDVVLWHMQESVTVVREAGLVVVFQLWTASAD